MTTPTVKGFLNPNTAVTAVNGANLNALASGSSVLSAAFSNMQGDSAGDGFRDAVAKLHVTGNVNVSAGGAITVWFLTASDGSLYEQGGTSVTPLKPPDIVFPPVVQNAAIDIELPCRVPICATIKALVQNTAIGAALTADNNGYIKLFFNTDQIPSV